MGAGREGGEEIVLLGLCAVRAVYGGGGGACLRSFVLQSRQLCIGVLTITIVVLTTVVMLAKAGTVAAVSIKMRTVRTTVTLATRTVTVW